MKINRIFLKRFLWAEIPLQVGISMLTGMFTVEISTFLLIGVIMLILCSWFIAFFGAYKSSKTVIQISILVWTVFIIGWIALSILLIAFGNKNYCVADKLRCAPSMWLFENGKSKDKTPARVEDKEENKNDLESFDESTLDDYDNNDEYEDEYDELEKDDNIISNDYGVDADEENNNAADGDEDNYAADDYENNYSADDESDMPENEFTNVRSMTDKTVERTTDASSYSNGISAITNPLSYLITRSILPDAMVKKNTMTSDDDDDDDAFANVIDIVPKIRVKSSFPFVTRCYRTTKTTVAPDVRRSVVKSPLKSKKKPGSKENRLKYLVTIVYFLVLFLYSWLVLVSYRVELQCLELCNCEHILCTK